MRTPQQEDTAKHTHTFEFVEDSYYCAGCNRFFNPHTIAAAPELLAALSELVVHLELAPDWDTDTLPMLIEDAGKAIEQALGN